MKTEAIFNNISARIKNEIEKAEKSIYIAVAWFTNRELFQILLDKANSNCEIYLIVSNDQINTKINFNLLQTTNAKFYKVGNGNSDLMHNKFCVIDFETVITGSYNWSYKASSNFENIVITKGDVILASQFIQEFNNILVNYFPQTIDLKNIPTTNQIITWNDKDLFSLKLEVRLLEYKITAFDNERTELNKILSNFQHRHSIELGNIILEILSLRKQKFELNSEEYKEAEQDQKTYQEELFNEKKNKVIKLTEDEEKELKKKYRKATMLCHPDKVGKEFENQAKEIFVVLQKAYSENDLKKVTQILNNLEQGNFLKLKSEVISERSILIETINKLREQVKILEMDIVSIRQNSTFKKITQIQNFDEYFELTKEQLLNELSILKNQPEEKTCGNNVYKT